MARIEPRYSLSRAANAVISKGNLGGYEAEWSATLEHSLSDKFTARVGKLNNLVPASAFRSSVTRAVDTGGSGKSLLGTRTQQMSGPLSWASVIQSGATLLGPLKDEVQLFFDSALPVPTWTVEGSAVIAADISFRGPVLAPHRLTAQIVTSMQLVKQFSGSPSLDEYLASKLKAAFASVTDQICLYGTGAPQPTGIISTTGCHAATVTVPPTWSDLANMRYLATNANADLSSFGWITNQQGRKYLESTPRFTNSAGSMWDFMSREAEVSLEVNDARIFAGVWAYQVIGYWLADSEGGIAADLTFDPYSKAEKGELIITGSVWVDVSPRWPELFCYSQASVFP